MGAGHSLGHRVGGLARTGFEGSKVECGGAEGGFLRTSRIRVVQEGAPGGKYALLLQIRPMQISVGSQCWRASGEAACRLRKGLEAGRRRRDGIQNGRALVRLCRKASEGVKQPQLLFWRRVNSNIESFCERRAICDLFWGAGCGAKQRPQSNSRLM